MVIVPSALVPCEHVAAASSSVASLSACSGKPSVWLLCPVAVEMDANPQMPSTIHSFVNNEFNSYSSIFFMQYE